MTVYSTPRSVFYTADGTSTNFNVPFQFFEIDVYVGEELQTATAYTVTQEAPGLSGSVTFNTAPASGAIVTIVGNTAIIQEADYVEGDGFSAETHELVLDRLTMAVQELDARQTGEIDTPPISPDFALTAAQNANIVTFVDGHAYQTPLGNVLSINNISPLGRTLNVGAIVFHPFEEVPSGWIRLKATQQPVAKALYPEYAAKCEAEGWPYGHTSTHVNVPAISAFIRAWDDSGLGGSNPMDPDGSSRLANGSATIVGNLIGSRQLSQNKSHSHAKGTLSGTTNSAGKHRHGYVNREAIGRDTGSGGVSLARGAGVSDNTAESGEHSHSLTITGSTADSGGSEARPDNVAFPYIMLLSPGDAAAPHSVLGLPYSFDDGTSNADPGTGNLRFNNATIASATEVYISNEQAFGASISGLLDQYNENNAPTRGYLLVYAVANLGVCAIAKVTGSATIGSDYTTLPVEVLSSHGEFLDGMRLSVQALPSGALDVSIEAAIAACEAAQSAAEIAQTGADVAQAAAEAAETDAEAAASAASGYATTASGHATTASAAAVTASNHSADAEEAKEAAEIAAADAIAAATSVNLPPSLTGHAGKHLAVKGDESGYELVEAETGDQSWLFYAALALEMSEAINTAIAAGAAGNGLFDGFGALTYVDTAGATNLDTSTPGVLKPSVPDVTAMSNLVFAENSNTWDGYNLIQLLPAASLIAGGTQARFRMRGPGTGSTAITGMTVAKKASSGDAYDAGETPVAITVSGSGAFTIPTSGDVWSDWIDYTLDDTVDLLIKMHFGASTNLRRRSGATGHQAYEKSASSEVTTANVTGYSPGTAGHSYVVEEIQVRAGDNNMTVNSTALSLSSSPTFVELVAFVSPGDAVVNTDLIAAASRDGVDFQDISLTSRYGRLDGSTVFSSGRVELTAGTGTTGKWQLRSANAKQPIVKAIGIQFFN